VQARNFQAEAIKSFDFWNKFKSNILFIVSDRKKIKNTTHYIFVAISMEREGVK
jgi:hypothetical protein